jgi:hypothetical protein
MGTGRESFRCQARTGGPPVNQALTMPDPGAFFSRLKGNKRYHSDSSRDEAHSDQRA